MKTAAPTRFCLLQEQITTHSNKFLHPNKQHLVESSSTGDTERMSEKENLPQQNPELEGAEAISGASVENPSEAPPKHAPVRKGAMYFILVTVALDMFAVGVIIPVLPKLIGSFVGNDATRTAQMIGIFGTAWAVMQFFFSPILGSLSDRVGRRPVVLASNIGLGLDYILMALSPTLAWLFVGRIISGITSSSIPTGFAYISDVTPPEKRAASFGMLSASFGLGFVLGPAVGGYLGGISPRLPFWVAAALSLLNACYGFFVLPESLKKENRSRFQWKKANPVGSLILLKRHKELLGLAAVLLLSYTAQQVFGTVYVLYADYRYHWSSMTVGFSLMVVGLFSVLMGGGVVRPFVKRFGERVALLFGLGFGVLGFFMFGYSSGGLLFWFGIPIMNLWTLAGPAAQGMMTHHVSSSEQGQLQGAVSSMRGISGLIGPSLYTAVFAFGIRPIVNVPGAPFYVAAALVGLAFLLGNAVTRGRIRKAA